MIRYVIAKRTEQQKFNEMCGKIIRLYILTLKVDFVREGLAILLNLSERKIQFLRNFELFFNLTVSKYSSQPLGF